MKFLIAGLGSIGRRHLHNLITLGEKDILLFRTHQSTIPDDDLKSFPVETDLKLALAQKPDAVIISNPTSIHLDVALPASEAGCHLFLEKPVSHSVESLDVLRANMLQHSKQTLVGFQFRFHPVLMQIKALLDSDEIGQPLSVHAHWGEYLPGWHPWEDYRKAYAARSDLGGGVVLTLCHPFDYLRWLVGEVESLSAIAGSVSNLELGVEDLAEVILSFKNGCIGSVHLDYLQRPKAHWMEITTSHGFIRWQNASGAAEVYHVSSDKWERINPPSGFERNDLFLAEMAHFLSVVQGVEKPRCSLEDGERALKIALAVYESAAKRNQLVQLS